MSTLYFLVPVFCPI